MFNKGINTLTKVIAVATTVVFIVLGLFFFFNFDPDAYDMQTNGTIVEIDEHYESIGGDNELMHNVYIDYQVGMKQYKHVEFPSYNSKMKVGDAVEFYYMSQDPTKITGADKNIAPYFGLGFAVIGFIMLIASVIRFLRGRF